MTPEHVLETRRIRRREAQAECMRLRRIAQTKKLRLRRGHNCDDCGLDAPLYWHHRDPSTKAFEIGRYLGRVTWARIVAEVDKCDLLCYPCHKRTPTYGRSRNGIKQTYFTPQPIAA